MPFILADVPRTRKVDVDFDLLLDHGETSTHTITWEVHVKTPDELHELRKECIESIKQDIENGKDIKPSDDIEMRFVWQLVDGWSNVLIPNGENKTMELPFNLQNFKRLMGVWEARVASIKKIKQTASREDLLEKN